MKLTNAKPKSIAIYSFCTFFAVSANRQPRHDALACGRNHYENNFSPVAGRDTRAGRLRFGSKSPRKPDPKTINWSERVGTYTYDQALGDLGSPPSLANPPRAGRLNGRSVAAPGFRLVWGLEAAPSGLAAVSAWAWAPRFPRRRAGEPALEVRQGRQAQGMVEGHLLSVLPTSRRQHVAPLLHT